MHEHVCRNLPTNLTYMVDVVRNRFYIGPIKNNLLHHFALSKSNKQ